VTANGTTENALYVKILKINIPYKILDSILYYLLKCLTIYYAQKAKIFLRKKIVSLCDDGATK